LTIEQSIVYKNHKLARSDLPPSLEESLPGGEICKLYTLINQAAENTRIHVVAELIGCGPEGGLEAQGKPVLICSDAASDSRHILHRFVQ